MAATVPTYTICELPPRLAPLWARRWVILDVYGTALVGRDTLAECLTWVVARLASQRALAERLGSRNGPATPGHDQPSK